MTTIPEPYVLATRDDLARNHLCHRNGKAIICFGAVADDWKPGVYGEKPICKSCMEQIEDREYRARWVRDGGGSGMGSGRRV